MEISPDAGLIIRTEKGHCEPWHNHRQAFCYDIPGASQARRSLAHLLCGVGFSVWGFKSPYVVSPHTGPIPLAVSLSIMLFFRPASTRQVFPPADPRTAHGRRAAKLAAKHKRKLNPAQTIVRVES